MKRMLFAAALMLAATGAQAQTGIGSNPSTHSASGYTRSTGTYVPPYVATNPNGTQRDNFGAAGNVNPNTGAVSTHTPRY
jgi:streptogramin lyase